MKLHTTWQWRPVAAAAAVALVALTTGCGQDPTGTAAQSQTPTTVEVVTVQPQTLTLQSEWPGRIEPVRVAEVRARVAGIVLQRNFEEGADVQAGQVLLRIDPAPLRLALARAQGDLARAKAALGEAQALVRRYAPLVEVEAVSRQDFEAAQAALGSAQAARQSAQAEVDAAQLNLDYATVRAPISGRIGRALVTEGALVGQGEATPLAVIQQLQPVYADFQQPAAQAQPLARGTPLVLTVDGTGRQHEGQLLFADAAVDRGTGQMTLRGRFDNRDGLLLPGMYVRVQMAQGTHPAAILVPQRAVRRGADGAASVLVVDGQDTVQARPVQTGAMQAGQWHITHGLQAGERVVVGRMAAAQPGAKVQAVAAPAAPAGKE